MLTNKVGMVCPSANLRGYKVRKEKNLCLHFVSQASSTGRHGSTDCTVPGAASLAD